MSPLSELPAVMQKLVDALKPGGVWYVSFKYGSGERVQGERRFTDLDEEGLRRLLKAVSGMEIASLWATRITARTENETWLNGILIKYAFRSCHGSGNNETTSAYFYQWEG